MGGELDGELGGELGGEVGRVPFGVDVHAHETLNVAPLHRRTWHW